MGGVILLAMVVLPVFVAYIVPRDRFGWSYLSLVVLAMVFDATTIVIPAKSTPLGQPDSQPGGFLTIAAVLLGWIWVGLICGVVRWRKGSERQLHS